MKYEFHPTTGCGGAPAPDKRLIERAHHIVVSAEILYNWMPRFGRTGERIR